MRSQLPSSTFIILVSLLCSVPPLFGGQIEPTGIILPVELENIDKIEELIAPFDATNSSDIRSWEFQVDDILLMVFSTRWDGLLIAYNHNTEKVIFSDQNLSRGIGGEVHLYRKNGISPDVVLTLEIFSGSGTGVYASSFFIYSLNNGYITKVYDGDLNGYSDACTGYREYDFHYEIIPAKDAVWQVTKHGSDVLFQCPEKMDCNSCYALKEGVKTVEQVDTSWLLSR